MKSKKKGKVDIEKQKRLENAKKVEVRAFIIFLVFFCYKYCIGKNFFTINITNKIGFLINFHGFFFIF